jgi:nitrate/nitrite transporter NarK
VRIQRLSVVSFFYSGAQLCFVAFTTVQLTTVGGFDLVRAGQMLAVYQTIGATSRPVWGWIADRFLTPAQTLTVHGGLMVVAMLLAGQISPAWPASAVLAVMVLAGCSAGGYTGVAYADYAHLGGARRTEATGLGTAVMFAGVMLIPSAFGFGVTAHGGFGLSYAVLAALVAGSAVLLCLPARPA